MSIKSCDMDEHGLACKAQAQADKALETAFTAGMLTIHVEWSKLLLVAGVDPTVILTVQRELEEVHGI